MYVDDVDPLSLSVLGAKPANPNVLVTEAVSMTMLLKVKGVLVVAVAVVVVAVVVDLVVAVNVVVVAVVVDTVVRVLVVVHLACDVGHCRVATSSYRVQIGTPTNIQGPLVSPTHPGQASLPSYNPRVTVVVVVVVDVVVVHSLDPTGHC